MFPSSFSGGSTSLLVNTADRTSYALCARHPHAFRSAEGEEIPAESMYEDVGQGSAIAAAAFSAPQGLGQNLPPPSVRAPPVPASIPTEGKFGCCCWIPVGRINSCARS